jgi:hypothetical protein
VANKTGKGGFTAGTSGNPGGRPKAASVIAIEARKHGLAMVAVLNTIARKGKSEQARIAAATALLDRGYGKPAQSVELNFHAKLLQKKLLEMSPDELRVLEQTAIQITGLDDDEAAGDMQLPFAGGVTTGLKHDQENPPAGQLPAVDDRQGEIGSAG